jgi:hypothetical protein
LHAHRFAVETGVSAMLPKEADLHQGLLAPFSKTPARRSQEKRAFS